MIKQLYTQKTFFDYVPRLVHVQEKWEGLDSLELIFTGQNLEPHEIAIGLYNLLPTGLMHPLVGDTEYTLIPPDGNIMFELGITFKFTIKETE